MKFLIFFLYFVVSNSYAFDCSYPTAYLEENNRKYSSRLSVSVNQQENGYHVTFLVPSLIEESDLQNIYIVKKDLDTKNEVFVIPVSTIDKGVNREGWFNINKKSFKNLYLYVDYGSECGFSVFRKITDINLDK